jgi:hypothetical protein
MTRIPDMLPRNPIFLGTAKILLISEKPFFRDQGGGAAPGCLYSVGKPPRRLQRSTGNPDPLPISCPIWDMKLAVICPMPTPKEHGFSVSFSREATNRFPHPIHTLLGVF